MPKEKSVDESSLEASAQKEKKLIHEITPIDESELAALLCMKEFHSLLRQSLARVVGDFPDEIEAGFKIIRDWVKASYHFSDVEVCEGSHVDLNTVVFPTFFPSAKELINTSPDETADPNSIHGWKALEVLCFHMHPITDGMSTWFQASSFDLKSIASSARMNSLKMRVESGMSARILRSIQSPTELGVDCDLLESLHAYYGYLIGGLFSPTKLPRVAVDSIESLYRPYTLIGMSISPRKIQILVLRDNPSLSDQRPQELKIFSEPAYDIEHDHEVQKVIEQYYALCGYDAKIIFVEFDEDGQADLRFGQG